MVEVAARELACLIVEGKLLGTHGTRLCAILRCERQGERLQRCSLMADTLRTHLAEMRDLKVKDGIRLTGTVTDLEALPQAQKHY